MDNRVICQVCGKKMAAINHLHLRCHSMTTAMYVASFPDAPLTSPETCDKRSAKLKGRIISWSDKIAVGVKKSWEENPAQGRTGVSLSKESRASLSAKLQGHSVSNEARMKIAKNSLGRTPWNKGKSKYFPEGSRAAGDVKN